jgi:hypothetical protein
MKKQVLLMGLIAILLTSCNSGGGSSSGNDNGNGNGSNTGGNTAFNPTSAYSFSSLASFNPELRSYTNPNTNEPFYVYNNLIQQTTQNAVLTINNGSFSNLGYLLSSSNLSTQYDLDMNGNVAKVLSKGNLTTYNPLTNAEVANYSYDSVTAENGTPILNATNTIIFFISSNGTVDQCPIGGDANSCSQVYLTGLNQDDQFRQVINNKLYVLYQNQNRLYTVNMNDGSNSNISLNLPSGYTATQFVIDSRDNNTAYVYALKGSLYGGIIKCVLSSNTCNLAFDNINTGGANYTDIAEDNNSLYFLKINGSINAQYSIVSFTKP